MIKSICMSNCATYPSEYVKIEDCQKVNFFYGPNGSGKSTISNFLFNPSSSQYHSCNIEWENDITVDTLVYNKEFRNRHFKEDIEGVFTLGEDTIEAIRIIDENIKEQNDKKNELATNQQSLKMKKNEEQDAKDKFRESVWNAILKHNESDFQEAFAGLRSNKERFRDEVVSRYKKAHSSSETRESLIKRSRTLFAKKPEKCNTIETTVFELISEIDKIEKDSIWNKLIVGNNDIPIAKLINVLNNADWVNKGRSYISKNGICPFCQQRTMTSDLEKQLSNFFSGEYERDINSVQKLIGQYETISERLVTAFRDVLDSNSVVQIGNLDVSKFEAILDVLIKNFKTTLMEINTKEKGAGEKVVISESKKMANNLLETIENANQDIINHNKMVDNYNEEKKQLIDDVWTYLMSEQNALISEYINKLSIFEKAKSGIQKSIDRCNKELKQIDENIIEYGKNITSIQPTVDEINRSLRAFGFTNFEIVASIKKENYYQIQRLDGTPVASTLSEGEETFISFLYFLQLAKGSLDAKKVSSKKILVLDDPISSLDSTVLYIVSSMVKSLIKNIRDNKSNIEQVFILTHNVFFHKEASFVDGRTKELNDVHYWIISKDNNITSVRSFGKVNQIKTSYELLWSELKTNSNASMITTQNIMRRIIENYFGMLGKRVDSMIVESFSTIEEKNICRSLISWINDGSHSIPDDLYIDSYTDSVERYKTVFKQIFVKMDHEAHYDMMMT